MYLPKSKYKSYKDTQGQTFVIKGTEEIYTGPYIKTYKNEYYSGVELTEVSKELEKRNVRGYEDTLVNLLDFKDIVGLLKLLKTRSPKVINSIRYFVQDKRNLKVVEVLERDYHEAAIVQGLTRAQIPWDNTDLSVVSDTSTKKKLQQIKDTKNLGILLQVEKTLPGISIQVPDMYELQVRSESKVDAITNLDTIRKASFDLR